MTDSRPTVSELYKAKAVTDDQVEEAVKAYLADPGTGPFAIADGHSIDLAAAIEASKFARGVMKDDTASQALRHSAARTAILLAATEKA